MSIINNGSAPPPGFEREVPRYRVSRYVYPSPNSRHRFEPPFASISDNNVWQFAERSFEAGEIIETKSWPHQTFIGLNFSAQKTLEYFNSRQKSRLPHSPWQVDRIVLDDGLTGPTQPKFPIKTGATAA
jgi:hypothetical protein